MTMTLHYQVIMIDIMNKQYDVKSQAAENPQQSRLFRNPPGQYFIRLDPP